MEQQTLRSVLKIRRLAQSFLYKLPGDGHSGVFGRQKISALKEFTNKIAIMNDSQNSVGTYWPEVKDFCRSIKAKTLRG
jgi:hypothetical protein